MKRHSACDAVPERADCDLVEVQLEEMGHARTGTWRFRPQSEGCPEGKGYEYVRRDRTEKAVDTVVIRGLIEARDKRTVQNPSEL